MITHRSSSCQVISYSLSEIFNDSKGIVKCVPSIHRESLYISPVNSIRDCKHKARLRDTGLSMDNLTECVTPSKSETIAVQTLFGIVRLLIIVANSLALVIFLGKKLRLKKSKYLLVNLTVADLLNGVAGVAYMAAIPGNRLPQSTWEKLLTTVVHLFLTLSILSLCVIALERAVAILFPFRHRQAEKTHYFAAIAVAWLLSMILTVFVGVSTFYNDSHLEIILLVSFLLEIGLIIISYLAIWIKRVFFNPMNSVMENRDENKKLSMTLFILIAISLLTWMPSTILNLFFKPYECWKKSSTYTMMYCTYFLLLSNSFLNVVIYSLRMPEFRKALKGMFSQSMEIEQRPAPGASAICKSAPHENILEVGPAVIFLRSLGPPRGNEGL
ncbi:tachykinin-like peptides receptor 86C [Nematostella vectensis]|uniref:tachykinin-like peptides receptor 86C n=1 Tax=Nematostella vectensis TaxID=45351 RepID=UPI0020770980|nr:tachykinin-like peptides receptor 86C [Nematostella vectensis]